MKKNKKHPKIMNFQWRNLKSWKKNCAEGATYDFYIAIVPDILSVLRNALGIFAVFFNETWKIRTNHVIPNISPSFSLGKLKK